VTPYVSRFTVFLLFTFHFSLFTAFPAHAQEIAGFQAGEEPVTITADTLTFDPDTNLYIAEGNVEIAQGNRILSADRATLNKDTKDARAEGRVVLMEDGDILSCETLEMNLDSRKGLIKKGRLFLRKGNVHLEGDEIEKKGDEDYTIRNGTFTTCDGESPSWSFSTTTADVTLGEYLTSWNTAFRIKGVPAFYTPYLIMPVKRERQSGFLIPRVSYSDQDGFEMDNSFFWAISKNTDATISLNYLSKKGVEEGLEYRYVLSRNTKGTFNGTYLSEWDGNERWTVKYRHEQFFTPSFYNKTNINYVSDSKYYKIYGEVVEERSQDKLESYVSFTKNWSRFSLVTQFKYFEDLRGEEESTLQRLPEVLLTGLRQPIGNSPFYFSLSSSAVNFYREEGVKGERVDIYPRLSMTLSPRGYFTFTPELGLRETAYWVEEAGEDRQYSREIYDLKGTISTTFIRIYNLNGDSLKRARHTIEPEVVYEYIPEVDQDDLPTFDPIDRIAKRNMATYSLINRVAGKIYTSEEEYHVRELVFLKISQGYDINEAGRELTVADDERRPFTDVTAQLRITPNHYINMISDAAFNTYDSYVRTVNTSVGVSDRRGDSLTIDHRFTKDSLEYIRGKVFIRTTESLDISYDGRYSIMEDRYLENIYAIDYRHQCWGIQLSYSERPEEKRYLLVFNLSGMGTVARLRGTTQY
jgi:LPS-assembly protein